MLFTNSTSQNDHPRSFHQQLGPVLPQEEVLEASKKNTPPLKKRWMTWKASVHDRTQLELVFDYLMNYTKKTKGGKRPQTPDYGLSFHFLFPPSIAPVGTSKENFFKSLKNILRIHTPAYDYCQKVDFPISNHYFSLGVKVAERLKLAKATIFEVKNFGNTINRRLKDLTPFDHSTTKKRNYLLTIKMIKQFRKKYMDPLRNTPTLVDREVFQAYARVDEYISQVLMNFYSLNSATDQIFVRYREKEIIYQEMFFPHLLDTDNGLMREKFAHRKSILKKFVSQSLYLDFIKINKTPIYKNFFAAIAAGLAALLANLLRFESPMVNGAQDYGFKFFFMLVLAVLVYIFKDRVKDLSKEYFNNRLKSTIPDQEKNYTYHSYRRDGADQVTNMAYTQEFARLVEESQVPDDIHFFIQHLRRFHQVEQGHSKLMLYHKKLWFNPQNMEVLQVDKLGLKDIFRFNVEAFLPLLDNAEKEIPIIDEDEGVASVKAPKTYYFYILIQIDTKRNSQSRDKQLEAVRLVINKEGIVRCEQMLSPGTFSYCEDYPICS